VPYFAYRIVKTSVPDAEAFKSHAERGDMPPKGISQEGLNDWDGVSVFETEEQAVRHARRLNWRLGRFIAELYIPDEAPISRDGADERGHFNLRAAGAVIVRYVNRVTAI
jgi:hypothetical protein